VINPKITPRDTTICKNDTVLLSTNYKNQYDNCSLPSSGLQSSLVTWYSFCGDTKDKSTSNNNSNNVGGTFVSDRNNQVSNSIKLNSKNQYFQSSKISNLTTNSFTYSFWVNADSTDKSISQGVTGGEGYGNRIVIHPTHGGNWNSSNNVGAGIAVGTNQISVSEHTHLYIGAPLVYKGNFAGWTHVVLVYDSHFPKLYVNGKLVKTGLKSSYTYVRPSMGYDSYYSKSGFGSGFNPNGNPVSQFYGSLDELGIWERALDSCMVK
jgi:hypothetical protein